MIRRLLRLSACLLPLSCGACAANIAISNGAASVLTGVMAMPILFDDGGGRMATSGGFYDTRWYSDPDSHPAVRPKPGDTGPADGTQVHPR
jgi:hypothetical protein